jgi:glycosyltransferase involved in cell wall biosynthesis
VGGHRELVRDGITGTLFKADDVEDLVKTLLDLLDQEERWPAMREAGRDYVENERNWINSVANLKAVYQRLAPGEYQPC